VREAHCPRPRDPAICGRDDGPRRVRHRAPGSRKKNARNPQAREHCAHPVLRSDESPAGGTSASSDERHTRRVHFMRERVNENAKGQKPSRSRSAGLLALRSRSEIRDQLRAAWADCPAMLCRRRITSIWSLSCSYAS
jgi:hypothetical protein